MTKAGLTIVLMCIYILYCPESVAAQDENAISAIPIVDVHAHAGSVERMGHYVKVSEILKGQYDVNLEIWIDLNFARQSDGREQEYLREANER